MRAVALGASLAAGAARGARESAPSIYFLFHPGEVSVWHAIALAELWLYHLGSPPTLTLGGDGERADLEHREALLLGPDIDAGQRPQRLVPPGIWQTARSGGSEATQVSCIVSLAFHKDEFVLLNR